MSSKWWYMCLISWLLAGVCLGKLPPSSKVKHVVLIMFENRSFDHMLGYLKKLNPEIDGLNGNETNPFDPSDPSSPTVQVSFDAEYYIGINPGHSVESTGIEIWGSEKEVNPPPMNGFVKEMLRSHPRNISDGVMRCYNDTSLPAMSTLAMEFAIFDRWYCSIPGPTEPNRLYLHSGTSHGAASNIIEKLIDGYPQRTIFDDVYESGYDFNVYFSDFPIVLDLKRVRDYPDHIKTIDAFYDDVKKGKLPTYSFLEPRWFDFLEWPESDQHPPHSVVYGEFLIKEIYDALRESPIWNETLFIITYDEHGGLYDHVPPPQEGVPNPDGMISKDPAFNFTRLGVRVPTLMISPWIEKNTVVHEPDSAHFDATSVAGTLRKMFSFKQPPLTKREAWSATFESVLNRDTPRTDCPTTIPVPPGTEELWEKYKEVQSKPETRENILEMLKKNPDYIDKSPLINELQSEIVDIAWGITGGDTERSEVKTVYEAATFVRKQMNRFYESKGKTGPFVTL